MLEASNDQSRDSAERACLHAGTALMSGDVNGATAYAATAVAARADFPAAYVLRARALRAQGERRAALADFERASRLVPDDAQLLVEQAHEYLALDEPADAFDCYQLALAHAPDYAAALLGFARMLRGMGDMRAALEQIRHAVQISPRDAEIRFESALLHGRCDDLAGAIAAYERGLELAPDNFAACANLGLLYLSRLGDARSAQQWFERAIMLEPASVAAQANLGLALEEQGRVDAALAHYEKLIAVYPNENEYRWNRGLALLASGDYARGWTDYEMRNARDRGAAPRHFPYPVWAGEKLPAGAALLIYGEQGLGDEVMFASCLPDLLARQIDCVIECDPRLAGLFARSFPAAKVHGAVRDGDRRWLADHPEIKAQCAIGSLPRLLRRAPAEFPACTRYLDADPKRVIGLRRRIKRESSGYNVGIAWRGGTPGTRVDLRSIPLHELTPILTMPRITFISLQRNAGNALAEIAATCGTRVLDFSKALDDVEEMAALCEALDHVVTVDNSVAHLAGALGCKTSIMLPRSADWRWLREQTTSPWYPSVTLCRQAAPGDWASAVALVKAELEATS